MESTNLWEFINSNVLLLYSVLLTVIFIITINQYNKLKSKITNLDSNLRSNAVKQGLTLEQWIPISENYPWDHRNFRFLGDPIDGIQFEDNKIAYTMGRHTNDYMTSFYSYSPSGFFVENGWGGRLIDPNTWKPELTNVGPSFWGHERLHLPKDQRLKFRDKRMEIAANGIQAPLIIDCPWLYQNQPKKDA